MTHGTARQDVGAALGRAYRESLSYLEGLEGASVASVRDLDDVRQALGGALPHSGLNPETVIASLIEATAGGHLGSAGGRFFGWVIGGALPAALAADWLVSTWDQNAASVATGPAAAAVEEVAAGWVKELLGLPGAASFAFTTGCQMAHATCLAAARSELLARRGWDADERGLAGGPVVRILSTDQVHGSVERAARLLGLGRASIMTVPADAAGRMRQADLEKQLASDAPTIVLLQAGDLNMGAFDDFEALIPIARGRGAWVHVDGAFGLWLAASPRHRHLLEGVAQADSWATDCHKWLNVPYDSGVAIIAHPEPHRRSMATRASYLTHAEDGRDAMDWTAEWSRRARAFPVYAALRQLGRQGLAELLERNCKAASDIARRIGALPGAELLWKPAINQGLVRFLSSDPDASQAMHDRRTEAVIEKINASGEAFFTGTSWRGMRAMRISVCNWRTSEADVDRAVAAAEQAVCELGGEPPRAA
ncbi:MAG TPA: aminotransferase class V-fold PLP-dependent enzyme [Allosphingosinicella sp.]|jgi:glutamate/tyrosine decarboxylase-like PLP-dependent enzyme